MRVVALVGADAIAARRASPAAHTGRPKADEASAGQEAWWKKSAMDGPSDARTASAQAPRTSPSINSRIILRCLQCMEMLKRAWRYVTATLKLSPFDVSGTAAANWARKFHETCEQRHYSTAACANAFRARNSATLVGLAQWFDFILLTVAAQHLSCQDAIHDSDIAARSGPIVEHK